MKPIKYLVKLEGDHYWIEPHHKTLWFGFARLEDAFKWLEENAQPDIEDDRITIRKVLEDGMQVVWQFFGWHYEDEYEMEQSAFPGHERSAYVELADKVV